MTTWTFLYSIVVFLPCYSSLINSIGTIAYIYLSVKQKGMYWCIKYSIYLFYVFFERLCKNIWILEFIMAIILTDSTAEVSALNRLFHSIKLFPISYSSVQKIALSTS